MVESTIKETMHIVGDTVYVHNNIQEITQTDKITGESNTFYKYEETKYTKDEFIKFLYDKVMSLEEKLNKVLGAS